MPDKTEVQSAFEAGVAHGTDTRLPLAAALVPGGYSVEDLQRFQGAPREIAAAVFAHDPDSFVGYFTQFNDGKSVIFADRQRFEFVGLIDYHGPLQPAWVKHRISYQLGQTVNWLKWKEWNERALGQADFAHYLETMLLDIYEPAGAALVEICRDLELKKATNFRSRVNLDTGLRELSFQEKDTNETVRIPATITLRLETHQGCGPRDVTAKIRYRMAEGVLNLWYELQRYEDVEDAVFREMAERISGAVDSKFWYGSVKA